MQPIAIWRHIEREPLCTLDEVLRRERVPFHYVDMLTAPPPAFDHGAIGGLVVLGGAMNVDDADKHPFLESEIDWLRRALVDDVPVLGICLGAQLVAAALGARVWHLPDKEIGWREVTLEPAAGDDRLLRHYREPTPTVFQWHGDTFDLPAGAVRLATSDECANQAFRYGDRAWALQFHPEVNPGIIECWLTGANGCRDMAVQAQIDPVEIRAGYANKLPRMKATGEQLFAEFARLCREASR